jgi:hypothetical protein
MAHGRMLKHPLEFHLDQSAQINWTIRAASAYATIAHQMQRGKRPVCKSNQETFCKRSKRS